MKAAPFVRWVGGSQKTVAELLARCPSDVAERRYVDPFLGGGALYWALQPRLALLSDACEPLIAAWRVLAIHPEALIQGLGELQAARAVADHREWYGAVCRDLLSPTLMCRAAALVAVNRSGFNGLWRENREGGYNVALNPASATRDLVRADLLRACAGVLRACEASIVARPWEATVAAAGAGDLIYADPPYDQEADEGAQPSLLGGPAAVEGHRYTAAGWTRGDLVRLVDALAAARERGAYVVATNNPTAFVCGLFASRGFRCDIVQTQRSVSCDASTRRAVGELIAVGEP